MPLMDDMGAVWYGDVEIVRVLRGLDEVWPKQPVRLAGTSPRWDIIDLTITPPAVGADRYVIRRGSTQIYDGAATTFRDAWPGAALMPSTGYTYTVTAYRNGAEVSTASTSVTTAARSAMVLTTSSPRWDQVSLSWTDPTAGSIDRYDIYRDGGYAGYVSVASKAYTGTTLNPSQSYSWQVDAMRSNVKIASSAMVPQTTKALSMAPMSGTAASWSQIDLTWANPGGLTYVHLRDSWGGDQQLGGTATSGSKTGLNGGGSYNFAVDGVRGSQRWRDLAGCSASTPARPTSSGHQNGPALVSSGGWTHSTAQTLNGPLFTVSGYVSSFDLYLGGYNATGDFDPFLGGHRYGWRDVPSGKTWRHVDAGSIHVNGQFRVGAYVGGSGRKPTAWQTYSGAAWNYNVACGTINYWWYTARDDGSPVTFSDPWWDPSLEGRDIHVESWVDGAGTVWKAEITDRHTGELLHQWQAPEGG